MKTQKTKRELLDTLAQSGAEKKSMRMNKAQAEVFGLGTDLSNVDVLKARTERKVVSQARVKSLIRVAERKGDTTLLKSFWNTYYCLNDFITADGRGHGDYCKTRFCTICCAIRKAQIINKYLPIIKLWKQPHFVTITVKAVPAYLLKKRVYDVKRAFKKITSKYRKWHSKGKAIKLMGVKSLECNFNPVSRTYNVHIHLIVPDRPIAMLIVQEWCKLWGKKFVNRAGQDIQEVKDPLETLIEIIKYGAKTFTDPLMRKKSPTKTSRFIYAAAHYNIIAAMNGHRIFDRFGFDLPKEATKRKHSESKIVTEHKNFCFDSKEQNWLDVETKQPLTDYKPAPELITVLENNIDEVLE